jgi:hypothetical protein
MTDYWAIFDIDGTLADDRHRRDLIDFNEPDLDRRYHPYHLKMLDDEPINLDLIEQWEGRIAFVTARPERYRTLTHLWLDKYIDGWKYGTHLFMRPDDDHSPSPKLKEKLFMKLASDPSYTISAVYEDRQDVIEHCAPIFPDWSFIHVTTCSAPPEEPHGAVARLPGEDVADILREMANTVEERSRQYGARFEVVPELVKVLWPNGVPSDLVTDPRWHLFELLLNKIARFATTNLQHQDSIHDAAVYSAIIESMIPEEQK